MSKQTNELCAVDPGSNLADFLVKSCPTPIIFQDTDGQITQWNDAAEELLGYSSEELLGKPLADILVGDEILQVPESATEAKGSQSIRFAMRFKTKAGSEIGAQVAHVPVIELDGKLLGHAWYLTPTLERFVDQGNRDFLELFRAVMDESDDVIKVADATTGRILDVNETGFRVLDETDGSLLSKYLTDDLLLPLGLSVTPSEFADQIRHEKVKVIYTDYKTHSGSSFPAEVTLKYIPLDRGYILCIVREITERQIAFEEREKLIQLIEHSADFIALSDINGQLQFMNAAARKMIGLDDGSDHFKLHFSDYIPPDWQNFFRTQLIPTALEKGIWEGEMQLLNMKTGERLDVFRTTFTIPDRSGVKKFFATVARDITKQKRAEVALKASEARMAEAQTLAHIGSWELDLASNVMTWSSEMCRLHYRDERLPMPSLTQFLRLVHPEDRSAGIRAWAEIPHRNSMLIHEYRTNPSLGPVRILRSTIQVQRSALGIPNRWVGATQDVTEQRRSEARIQQLVESNAQGVYFASIHGPIYYANDAFLNMLGYTKEDVAAGRLNWKDLTPTELSPNDLKMQSDLIKRGHCVPFQKEYLHKDGRRVPALIAIDTFKDQPEEGVCFVLDLTEFKKLEMQLLRSQRLESIGTLASGIAHDLNNILTPILLSVSMLKETVSDSLEMESLETIEASALRGAEIVRQVLSFARGVKGERVEVSTDKVLIELKTIIKETFPKNIRLKFTGGHPLWDVLGDPTQIHQVLLNLCVNSRDAMVKGGSLNVDTRNCEITADLPMTTPPLDSGKYVRFEVTDTGVGMPAEMLDRIFEPFFTTKQLHQGTGLGLSTVMAIIKSHGGSVQVTSRVGVGTTFLIYLPAILPSELAIKGVGAREKLKSGADQTVLLVDDETPILTITKRILMAAGFRVVTAQNGSEALSIYRNGGDGIDLVVTDSMMPIMDGLSLIEALRQINPAVKVILMSGLTSKVESTREIPVPSAFIRKPFTQTLLLETIDKILSQRGGV